MKKISITTQSFVIASMLASFLIMPAHADDLQPAQPREPFYVWEGNRIDNHRPLEQGVYTVLQPVQAGNVRYITGGIGDEERDTLEAVKNDYNLHIINASTNGEYNGDTQIAIFDSSGTQLVSADAGPLFYARLPRGVYRVEVSSNGSVQKRKIAVGESSAPTVYFRW